MGKLVLYRPDGTTRDIYLTKERMTIGRRADNDIALPFGPVSGEHAVVITLLSDSFLQDLGSTNGTLVNGRPITKHFLRDRDHIDIGRENLVYYAEDNALPDALPDELLQRFDQALAQSRGATDRAAPQRSDDDASVAIATPESTDPGKHGVEHTMPFRSLISDPESAAASGEDPAGSIHSVDTESKDNASFAIRVLTGPNAGRELSITKAETIIGRVGLGVAVLKKEGTLIRLTHIEGADVSRCRGAPVPPDGAVLAPGDSFEVAGETLSLIRR